MEHQLKDRKKHTLINKVIDGYKIIEHIGTGGNAEVFKVRDGKGKTWAMKLLKVFNGISFNKKYERFKDEIKVVIENQNDIQGIVPIDKSYLPENPHYQKRPWYTMPIAIPLEEKINLKHSDISEVVDCVKSIALLLFELHSKGIVHRDIKPNNIYWYNNQWCLGDFGLVDYPTKKDLTTTFESVGPKSTIAPEMKRDAKNSDGKKADIYSLAKTLWILLTGNKQGFDGQYTHRYALISLANYRKKCFLVTLHSLLHKSTSTDPNERPDAYSFYETLSEYESVQNDFKKTNILEWEFVIRELFPVTLVDSVSWTDLTQIVTVLKLISSINGLNHMFLPTGGGMDLLDCNISEDPGYIELNFGYISKVKAKKLTLNTFEISFDWNYFLLETEEVAPSGVYKYDNITDIYREQLLELSPGKYIEDYHINYGQYNGQPLPPTAREIDLVLKGTYCIFAKGSTYNSISSTYSAYQNKYSAEDFKKFIEAIIKRIEFEKQFPEIAAQQREQREREKQIEHEKKIAKLKEEDEILKRNWKTHLCQIEMPAIPIIKVNPIATYSLTLDDQHFETLYYISKNNKIVEYSKGTFRGVLDQIDYQSSCLLFTSFEDIKEYIDILKERLFNFDINDELFQILFLFNIHIHRIQRPSTIPSKRELEEVLKNGDDSKSNRIFLDLNGHFRLIPTDEYDYIYASQFPVKGYDFDALQNSVGKLADLSYLDSLYLGFLTAWRMHLLYDKKENIQNWSDLKYTEEQLIEEIHNIMMKYNER